MTYPDFLEALRQTPRDWEISYGRIRRRGVLIECPISSLCGAAANHWEEAADKFNLYSCSPILAAADNDRESADFSASIRRDLLEACGLKEQP